MIDPLDVPYDWGRAGPPIGSKLLFTGDQWVSVEFTREEVQARLAGEEARGEVTPERREYLLSEIEKRR